MVGSEQYFMNVRHLKGNAGETPFVVASSQIIMSTDAPLAPEYALGSLGSGLASLLSSLLQQTGEMKRA
jgi:hypothetical protein